METRQFEKPFKYCAKVLRLRFQAWCISQKCNGNTICEFTASHNPPWRLKTWFFCFFCGGKNSRCNQKSHPQHQRDHRVSSKTAVRPTFFFFFLMRISIQKFRWSCNCTEGKLSKCQLKVGGLLANVSRKILRSHVNSAPNNTFAKVCGVVATLHQTWNSRRKMQKSSEGGSQFHTAFNQTHSPQYLQTAAKKKKNNSKSSSLRLHWVLSSLKTNTLRSNLKPKQCLFFQTSEKTNLFQLVFSNVMLKVASGRRIRYL